MRIHLVSRLPWLDAMVAKFCMCKIKESNFIYYFSVILFLFIFQIRCNRMVANYLFYLLFHMQKNNEQFFLHKNIMSLLLVT